MLSPTSSEVYELINLDKSDFLGGFLDLYWINSTFKNN